MATEAQINEIYTYTVGLFKAAPGGFLNDLQAYVDAGNSTSDMASVLAESSVFTGLTSAYSAGAPDSVFVSTFLTNLLGDSVSDANFAVAETALNDMLTAGSTRAEVAVTAIDLIAAVDPSDADWGGANVLLNDRIALAENYNDNPFAWSDDNGDGSVAPSTDLATLQSVIEASGTTFNLTPVLADTPDGADVMRLTGDQAVRIDFTDASNQVTGLDYDADGAIDQDGVENAVTGVASDFDVVDAYARNPLNAHDAMSNFLGNIDYDGTGVDGDGVDTDGNIFLGGLGADVARAGIGNDFLAGGGVAGDGDDNMYGGRNADFFFASLSDLSTTDGDSLRIDGGQTTDDSAVVGDTAMDSDWLLLEVADDEDGTIVDLRAHDAAGNVIQGSDGNSTDDADTQWVLSGNSASFVWMNEIENVDASGNLYGFLDNIDVAVGENGMMTESGENVAIGATSQLNIIGSFQSNILIGGFDNDLIQGDDGDDLLMGGNLAYNNNPNTTGIVNDGVDELIGGAGSDNIVFEADGGIVEGGAVIDQDDAVSDTLWLTDMSLGTATIADVAADETLRFDLGAGKDGGYDNFAGYGGADQGGTAADWTADQTNYNADYDFVQVQDMESVIATGLGAVDFLAAGTNDPELSFNNQQNFFAYEGDLTLRGTDGDNTLYANTGDDILEGRNGDDMLSGGTGNDDFIFALDGDNGADGLDVIHRQDDADGDNIWDVDADGNGTFGQDFGLDETITSGESALVLTVFEQDAANNPINDLANITVNQISTVVKDPVNGDIAVTISSANSDIAAANTHDDLLSAIQTAILTLGIPELLAADGSPLLTATLLADNSIVISHELGYEMTDTDADGATFSVSANNIDAEFGMTYEIPAVATAEDRLIFASYEDRADGELVDDNGFVNETGDAVSLGADAYAEDLVVRFDSDGNGTTVLAEDQQWDLTFENIADEDTVSISVNGTAFSLQMGVAADGTAIVETMPEFLERMEDLINAGSDNDTLAGSLVAAHVAGTDVISLTQGNYYGGQVAFMDMPVVTLGNASGGEAASVTIDQPNTDSEVTLFEFDGKDNALNEDSVLFLGGSGMNDGEVTNADNSRSVLATAAVAGGDLMGSDALVVDSMLDVDTVATDFSLHGDDLLFTGAGDDDVYAGTGDDRIFGSVGTDTVDGGKDLYVVQTLVAGEVVEAVETLNDFDAAARLAAADVVNVTLLEQDSTAGAQAGFVDHLIFSTADFAGTQFTVTVDDDLTQEFGGAGTVGVDEGDDGVIDHTTTFTEIEAVRTLAGDGTHAGQGNDTLNVTALSDAVAASEVGDTNAAVVYNMTSALGFVAITADLDADNAADDTINDFIAVDGVERLIGGNANELLNIDESEVNKDNYFDGDDEVVAVGDLVGDSIVYNHTDMDNSGAADDDGVIAVAGVLDFTDGEAVSMRPSLELVVESAGETDMVKMTGGTIIGSDTTIDTLKDVETVDVTNAAFSAYLDDTLNVSNVNGAYVDYAGTVGTSNADADVVIQIAGMTEIENVQGSTGADTVAVADTMTNYRAYDSADATTAISYASFLDYDTFNAGARTAFSSIPAANRSEANNQALFTFDLADGQDRVDYDAETGNIAAVVNLEDGEVAQTVFVMGADTDLADATDRVDLLQNVEEVVASQGESTLDFTGAATNLSISYMAAADSAVSADYADTREHTIAIEDLDSSVPFGDFSYIELMDDADGDAVVGETALWNRIEGSDNDETIQLTDDQSAQAHTFNLRGGANEVNYNELTKGIELTFANDAAVDTNGVTTATIGAKDTAGVLTGVVDTITTYNQNWTDGATAGTLRIEASQSENDTINLSNVTNQNVILLGASEGLSDVINVSFGTASTDVEMVLTGFEALQDGAGDDEYVVDDLTSFFDTLALIDNAAADIDTLVLTDGALEDAGAVLVTDFSGANPTIDLDTVEADIATLNGGTAFDFDILDVRQITEDGLTLINAEAGETVIIGDMDLVDTVNDFAVIALSDDAAAGTVTAGDSFTFDLDANELTGGGETVAIEDGVVTTLDTTRIAADISITVNDDAAAGATIIAGAGNDTITGGGGADSITGGAGADSMSGGVEVGATHEFVLTGTVLGNTGDEASFTFGDTTTAVIDEGDEIPTGADLDQLGQAFADFDWSTITFDHDDNAGTAVVAGSELFDSVTYDAITNTISFNYSAAYDDVDAAALDLVVVGDLVGDATDVEIDGVSLAGGAPAVVGTFTGFAGNGADVFVIDAADSGATATTADVITDFETGVDTIDLDVVVANYTEADGAAFADFDAFLAAAELAIDANANAIDAYVAYDVAGSGDGWLALDSNADDTVDTVIQLTGIAVAADFDAADLV